LEKGELWHGFIVFVVMSKRMRRKETALSSFVDRMLCFMTNPLVGLIDVCVGAFEAPFAAPCGWRAKTSSYSVAKWNPKVKIDIDGTQFIVAFYD
jgi:hypothetical protein